MTLDICLIEFELLLDSDFFNRFGVGLKLPSQFRIFEISIVHNLFCNP